VAVIEIEVRSDSRQAERALDRVRSTVRQLDRSLDQAGQAADGATRDIRQGARQAGSALDQAADSADDLGVALDDTGDGGDRLGDMLGDLTGRAGGFGDMIAGLGPIGAAAAAAVGAAFIGIGAAVKGAMAAAEASMERTNSLAVQKAQLGLTPAEAAEFGATAGKVYVDNFGDSIEDAGNAVRDAVRILGSSADPALEAVAKKVSNLARVTGRDTQQIGFAIKQMLVTGMAGNVGQAFDLLHSAIAAGADGMDDLIDSMTEYPALLKQSGLNAEELFGILSQGMNAGAFGTDKIVDALKEFRLRVTGGGKAIDEAFKTLGINGKQATAAIAKGGRDGAAALDQVLDKIRALNEVDPGAAAKAIQDLFGGPGEDLGASIFALDVDKAADALGNIEGAADRASATLSGSAYNAVESYRRQWEMLKADVGDDLIPVFEEVAKTIGDVVDALKPIASSGMDDIADMWRDNKDAIDDFWSLAEPVLKLLGGAAIGAVVLAIGQMINAMTLAGKAWGAIKDVFASVTPFILDQLEMILEGAADAFGWIPGIGDKLKKARDDFQKFKDDVNNALAGIKDRTVTVAVRTAGDAASLLKSGNAVRAGNIIGYASGTMNAPPGYAVVGEEGPELVKFKGGERVHTTADSAAMMANWNGGPVRQGQVSAATWQALKAAGWRGDPNDRMEALYRPPDVSVAVQGVGTTGSAIATLFNAALRNGDIKLKVDRGGNVVVAR